MKLLPDKLPTITFNIKLVLWGIAAILLLIAIWYVAYRQGLRPADITQTQKQSFTVKSGQSVSTIAANLDESGMIRSQRSFLTYVSIHGLRAKFQAGFYEISQSQSTPDIISLMVGGQTSSNRLTIKEGENLSQIAKSVAAVGIAEADFQAALAATDYRSPLASARPAGLSLEGYLFPDTYNVDPSMTAHDLVQAMLDDLAAKVTPDLQAAFAAKGFTPHQAMALASVIEKEVPKDADRAIVAQIFEKRLATGQPLESDVTVAYASELANMPFNLSINSPYNTYRNVGVPVGPICAISLSAMQAVANPAPTDYLYFLADNDGNTHYAKTFAEHQKNVQKYLR